MPVILGVAANMTVPKVCRKVEPFCPLVGVAVTVILVGASVAQCSRVRFHPLAAVRGSSDWGPLPHAPQDILAAGLALQWPLFALHLFGGVAGYWLPRLAGQARRRVPQEACAHPQLSRCTAVPPDHSRRRSAVLWPSRRR